MRRIARSAQVSLLILGSLAVVAYGQRTSSGIEAGSKKWTAAQSESIRQAGKRLGVPVRTERMVHFAQSGASWFAAAAAKLETTPATELTHGVNVGVAYFDLPGQKFPKGFYKMRVFADVKQVGRVEARGQIVNDKGEIVGELPATVDVKSMTLPERPMSRLTPVALCTGAACNIGGGTPPIVGFWACYDCWNGMIICFHFAFIDKSFWE